MTYEQALAIAVGRGVSLKPVLFSAPMVQAILEDRKTQTRRVIKPQPIKVFKENGVDVLIDDGRTNAGKRPYAEGDILWVRETWRCMGFDDEIEEPKMLIQYRDESSRWVAMRNYARFKKFAV
ncbi:MAG: hypothetical protein LBC88_04715, partial [Spirochaetaceae bacterium]|nr:hypothetical protein [Spirochaetaceae bacterium]